MAFSRNLRVIVLVAFLVATFLLISSQAAAVAHSHGTAIASDQLGRKVRAERQVSYGYPPPYSGGYAPPGGGYTPPYGGYAPPYGGYRPPYGGRPPRGGGGYSTYPAPPGAGK